MVMVVFDAQAAAGAVRARLGLARSKTKVMASAYTPAAAANAMHGRPEKQKGRLAAAPAGSRFSIGAGDEIRTHDPNLGKVVLYP